MKRIKFNIEDIFNLNDSVIYNPDGYKAASKVSIDSRDVSKSSIFVAIKGDKFDGHDFVSEVVEKGVSAIVINKKKLKSFDKIDTTIITVPDTIKAYGELARIKRLKMDATVISITGSSGKTTTKNMVADILSSKYKVFKTQSNNNNHIGVPLTILSAPNDTEMLILEHGSNHFGEIKYTTEIAVPNIAIITNIGNSHLEYFGDKKGVLKEKLEIFSKLKDENSIALISRDDKLLREVKLKSNIKYYGKNIKNSISGKLLKYDNVGLAEINLKFDGKSIKVKSPLPGEANFKNLLAASSIAFSVGMKPNEIKKAIKNIAPVKSRLNFYDFKSHALVDDTYNSNPESLLNAVNFLTKVSKYRKKYFILGDMLELGSDATLLHQELAENFLKNKNITVLTIGENMKKLSEEIHRRGGIASHFKSREALTNLLAMISLEGAVFLFKGSRGMKMEDFCNILMERSK